MLSMDTLVAGLDVHKKTVVVVILQKGQPTKMAIFAQPLEKV